MYQLRVLGQPLDIIVGLSGRGLAEWNSAMRPAPRSVRFISLDQARAAHGTYACIVAHNLTDLIESKGIDAPRLFVIHNTLEHLIVEQDTQTPPAQLRAATAKYLDLLRAEPLAISEMKARSWELHARVVSCFADVNDYQPHLGDLARGLRIANDVARKRKTLSWDFYEAAFGKLPLTLIGRNEDMPGVRAARDWEELKDALSHHRFFIHTADPRFEDGYNMATLEAMAAGLPVLGNRHPSSPIEHGKSGFLSDDPAELREFALRLLKDRELAMRLGACARETVLNKFHPAKFKTGVSEAIERAQRKWRVRAPAAAGCVR